MVHESRFCTTRPSALSFSAVGARPSERHTILNQPLPSTTSFVSEKDVRSSGDETQRQEHSGQEVKNGPHHSSTSAENSSHCPEIARKLVARSPAARSRRGGGPTGRGRARLCHFNRNSGPQKNNDKVTDYPIATDKHRESAQIRPRPQRHPRLFGKFFLKNAKYCGKKAPFLNLNAAPAPKYAPHPMNATSCPQAIGQRKRPGIKSRLSNSSRKSQAIVQRKHP